MVELGQLAEREWPRGEWGGKRASEERRGRLSEAAIEGRLQLLRRSGYIRSERWFYGRPQVWLATAKGLRAAGLPFEPPSVDVRSYDHDIEAVWLGIRLQEQVAPGRDDIEILTEREIRHHDAGGGEPSGRSPRPGDVAYSLVWEGSSRFSKRRHFPDFAAADYDPEDGRPMVIELERTAKAPARLNSIAEAYRGAVHIARVLYVVTNDKAEAAVRRAIERAHRSYEEDYYTPIEVLRWEPPGALRRSGEQNGGA